MFLRRLNTIHYNTNNLNKKSMKKKEYESPTTQIVELKHVGMLMTSNGVGAMRSGYGTASTDEGTEDTWE